MLLRHMTKKYFTPQYLHKLKEVLPYEWLFTGQVLCFLVRKNFLAEKKKYGKKKLWQKKIMVKKLFLAVAS